MEVDPLLSVNFRRASVTLNMSLIRHQQAEAGLDIFAAPPSGQRKVGGYHYRFRVYYDLFCWPNATLTSGEWFIDFWDRG